MKDISPIEWKNFKLKVLDQTLLPHIKKYILCSHFKEVGEAIKDMKLRGAPLIGITAAMAVAMEMKKNKAGNYASLHRDLKTIADYLIKTRPTAVNLRWALERLIKTAEHNKDRRPSSIRDLIIAEVNKIYKEDLENNKAIGKFGAELIREKDRILTHCNAGALATAGYGTAVGVIRAAHEKKKKISVLVDETRPYLQGARLTAWEMSELGIPHVLITDNMAGHFMQKGMVDVVIVGADRIATNGDTANKIGTYSLAVLAREHKIPFYVAAPSSTIDFRIKTGAEIIIEERDEKEVKIIAGKEMAPKKTKALNPAFDVTPAKYISAIITEKGVIRAPYDLNLEKTFLNKETIASL